MIASPSIGNGSGAITYDVQPDILKLSKALGEETRFAIFREIAAANTPLTVRDLVEIFGMHHSAIRIHLSRLEEAGLIVSRTLRRPGVVGRPQLVYQPNPTTTSFTLPPRNYELLAQVALEYAAEGINGDSPAHDFGTAWGRAHVRESRPADPLPLADAVPALVAELRALGGNPELEDLNGEGFSLVEHNCLFGEVSASHRPLVCSLHQGLAQGMLQELAGEPFQWTSHSTIAGGADHCHIDIRPASTPAPAALEA